MPAMLNSSLEHRSAKGVLKQLTDRTANGVLQTSANTITGVQNTPGGGCSLSRYQNHKEVCHGVRNRRHVKVPASHSGTLK